MQNEYSVNLPTRFYYKGQWNDGWINVLNPLPAIIVLGAPGSGKSYAIINNISRKAFQCISMTLSLMTFRRLLITISLKHTHKYKVKPKFYFINFDNSSKSHHYNPLNLNFMTDISDAYEAAYTIMLNLNRSWI